MDEMDEIVQDFLVECHEMLDHLDESFVMLEENPSDTVVLSSIFRVLHTIKGTCSFLAFTNLEHVAHKGENLLSPLRDAKLVLDTEMEDEQRELTALDTRLVPERDGVGGRRVQPAARHAEHHRHWLGALHVQRGDARPA